MTTRLRRAREDGPSPAQSGGGRSARQGDRTHGYTLIEVLIALVVLTFGTLALARMLARAGDAELEAVQRTQAMALAQDMVDRINLNRVRAADYIGTYVPGADAEECEVGPDAQADPAKTVLRDRCQWTNLLQGAAVVDGGRSIGAPIAARGCITSPTPNVYLVAVAWQGIVPTAPPPSDCGVDAFDREANRRVFSTVVQIATLSL
ncbi:MAG TPA: type IV pilus modification protein PilV [Casimicrobiaceae bacterium]|nr:type IV pilus modification protein PilV [Casimicrobiaceae bacterium]